MDLHRDSGALHGHILQSSQTNMPLLYDRRIVSTSIMHAFAARLESLSPSPGLPVQGRYGNDTGRQITVGRIFFSVLEINCRMNFSGPLQQAQVAGVPSMTDTS